MARLGWLTIAFLSALAVFTPEARADNTADEAEHRFRRGVEFYRNGRFDDALSEFFHSNRLVPNRNVILNIARSYEQLRRYDEAYRYYADVLEEDPTPEDVKIVEQSLARLAPRVALLSVETEPPGAEIFVERKDLGSRGRSPRTLALPPGKVKVIASLEGHRDGVAEVVLQRGKVANAKIELPFIFAELEISGAPEGAEVRVDRNDGEPQAILPATIEVRPGRRILTVQAPGFITAQIPVDAKAGERTQVKVDLVPLPPPTGKLVVTANHEGSLITVDGRESGFAPAVIPLPEGSYRVRVSFEDLDPHEETVEVRAEELTRVNAVLRYGQAKITAASKTETSVEDAPASITVISRDEILAFGYTSLPDALRWVRGMFLNNDRTYDYLGVRGFAPPGDFNNRILILYDGHPMNDLFAGQAYLGRENNIDLSEVERIEVVRGPVSSLFGSAAFFGVINIVPRHHMGDRNVELSGAAGSLGLGRGRATLAHKGEEWQVIGTFGGLTARGDEALFLPELGPAGAVVRNRDGERVLNGSGRASYKGFSLLGSINSRRKDVPTAPYGTVVELPGTGVSDTRAFAEARFDHDFDSGANFTARGYYDATRFVGNYLQPAPLGMEVDTGGADWGGLEVRYRTPEFLKQRLTLGAEFQHQFRIYQTVTTSEGLGLDDRQTFSVASAYAVDEIRLGRLLLINGSVRADYYFDGPNGTPSFGLTVNPRLAFISRLYEGGLTKLMGGRSFRAPTAYERFYHDGVVGPDGQLVYQTERPNPGVGPETILTAELEHTHEINPELRVTGAIFVNQISNLISTQVDEHGIAFSGNAPGNARTQGAEAELRWQPRRLTLVTAGYWFQQMILTGIERELEARLRANAPAHAFALRGMHPLLAPTLIGSLEIIYNSDRLVRDGSARSGDHLLINAGLSGEIFNTRFRYYAGVQNLLDQRPYLPAGDEVVPLTLPGYGRTFLLQLSASY